MNYLMNNKAVSDDWLKMVKTLKEKNLPRPVNYTNNEHKFGEFLLANKEEIKKIGDLRHVFETVYRYIKHEDHE